MKQFLCLTIFLLLNFFSTTYGQLQIGVGPAVFISSEKGSDKISYDYTLSLAYQINKFDIGLEFIQNGYRGEGKSKENYHFYQYQVFGRFFPLSKRNIYIKTGTNISDEFSYKKVSSGNSFIEVTENGTLLGLEGGLGFQDRLLKKTDLFIDVSLTYNHLYLIKDGYYYNYKKTPTNFYALKMSLIYLFDF